MYQKLTKMENSLLVNFEKIWPKTLCYSTGTLSNLKIHKKSNFDQNQLKLSTQHKDMYMHQKNYKNGEFSPSHSKQKKMRSRRRDGMAAQKNIQLQF